MMRLNGGRRRLLDPSLGPAILSGRFTLAGTLRGAVMTGSGTRRR